MIRTPPASLDPDAPLLSQLVIAPDGLTIWGVYHDAWSCRQLGGVQLRRASYVEPDEAGLWQVDLGPVGGPLLGPFPCRGAALRAETLWLATWLSTRQLADDSPSLPFPLENLDHDRS